MGGGGGVRKERGFLLTFGLLLEEFFTRSCAAWCFGVRHRYDLLEELFCEECVED